MPDDTVYRVRVCHNVVVAIEKMARPAGVAVPPERLDIGAQLARNNRAKGCIDDYYYFAGANAAKDFAVLCLDFVSRLLERASADIAGHNFHTGPDWRNPHAPGAAPDG